MQSCTECGTPISPAVGPPVLLNGNVVCQPCWQKVGADAPARPAQPSSRAATSRRSVSSTAPASSRRATSTTPAARRSTSTREEAPAPASRPGRSTSRSGTARSSSTPSSADAPRATSRTAAMIEEVESSTGSERLKLYIIIAMCVMIVIAAVAGLMWKSKTERDEREAKAASVAAENAMGDIQRIIHDDPENFDKQLEAIKAAEDKVKNFGAHRNNLLTIQSEVTGKKEAFETKKQAGEILAQLKKDLQDPSKLDSVSLTIGAAKRFESSQGPEFKAELKAIEEQLTLAVLKRAFDAAKAKEAAGDPAQALAAYDEAVVTFNKMFDKMTVVPKPLVDLYKELLAESDKLVERTETPDYEASVPERDMLSTKERPLWGGSEGIKFAFSGRELKIDGVDSGKKITGIFSLVPPRATPWHDIVIDLEFTILSEGFEMFVRHEQGKKPYRIGFKPSDNYELNKPYRMTLRVKGSSLTLKAPDQPENRDKFEATTSRTGGIAFGLNKGASVVISSCKIKVLRPKGG